MKKILILLLLIVILTEAAFAASVKIGVIDTGVTQKEHILDSSRILEGKNYVSEYGGTEDKVGHGTRVASLILGTLDNEIISPSSESQIVPLVYYSQYPSGVAINGGIQAICSAIYDAIDSYGCKIINISSGVPKENEALKKAVDYAEEKGVLIVSACGNDGGSVYYPAAYPTVIGVGSHNETLEPSAFSCHGSGLDLLFSGEKVNAVSIKNADDYELVTGTSYSAALITSYAAAALEAYPELLPHQIRYFLRSSCEDICEKGYDAESGYGIFDPNLFFEHLSLFDKGEISCFSDVKKTDWYFDSVCYAEQNRLFLGVSDTEFAPNELLTRAMFITILYRADGRPQTNNMLKFDDVAEDAYYADAVCWASENGIITGVSDGKFAPDQNMTREEIAAVMSRYADYKGIHTASQGDLTVFADADAVSGWARESVAWAVDYGLLSGKENNLLDPRGDTTRAEAAAILKRFLEQ